jgi:hypothetical protein
MSEATIEYKNSPNDSTAYVVSEGQKTKVQLVATPAGDLELANNPNVDTGYLVIDGEKHKCALVAEVDGELKLPTSATDDSGYVTTQDGRQHKVKLVANITGGGTQINNQNINVTQNGIYQPEEGYTGLGTVNVNVASGSPTQKFGATVDMFLGDVDANGAYKKSTTPLYVNLVGATSIAMDALRFRFAGTAEFDFAADDVTSVGWQGMAYAFYSNTGSYKPKRISFANLEVVDQYCAFEQCFYSNGDENYITFNFPKLKVISGERAFSKFATSYAGEVDDVFPALEEVSGNSSLDGFIKYQNRNGLPLTFSKLKKATGSTTYQPSAPFGYPQTNGNVWNFPSATEFVGYLWASSSDTGEIHFAAANQAAIEACEGYANKWGFKNATIYFDL